MPFTRNHYYGTGSAKHSSFSYMTRALRALVCNCMTSCFAKPSSVIMISCKRYKPSFLKDLVFPTAHAIDSFVQPAFFLNIVYYKITENIPIIAQCTTAKVHFNNS